MSRTRDDLHNKLLEICDNVYCQAPRDDRMVYPCIKYSLNKIQLKHANNKVYNHKKRYTLTYITKDPDDPMIEGILYLLDNIKFDRPYKADNLYHNVYDLYF